MGSTAKAFILGNITRDPELKYIASGTALLELSVAVNERVKKGDDYEDRVSFFDCIAWGKTAENIHKYHKKGDPIHLECTPRQDRWEDKESGKNRSKIVFRVERFTFVKSSGGASGGSSEGGGQTQQQTPPAGHGGDPPADDIPF